MTLEHIELHNWKQHRAVVVEINSSTVGLVGRNGQGKSNFLGAIETLTTGVFNPEKERCLTWGEKKGHGKLRYRLADGRKMTIYRELHSSVATLEITGEPKLTGANKVNARIQEILGVDQGILQNVVFVRQDAVQALLFGGMDKERLAARFFGLEKCGGIEKILAAEINKIDFVDAGDAAPALRVRLEALGNEVSVLDSQIAKQKPSAQIEAELIALEADRTFHASLSSRVDFYRRVKGEVDRLGGELGGITTLLAANRTAYETNKKALSSFDITAARTLKARDEQQLRKNQQITTATTTLEEAEKQLTAVLEEGLPFSQQEIEEKKRERDDLAEEANDTAASLRQKKQALFDLGRELPFSPELILSPENRATVVASVEALDKVIFLSKHGIAQRSVLVNAVGTAVTCTTCGQAVDQQHIGVLREEIEKLQGALQEAQAARALHIGALDASDRHGAAQKLGESITQLRQEIEALEKNYTDRMGRAAVMAQEFEPKEKANQQWENNRRLQESLVDNSRRKLQELGPEVPADPAKFQQIEDIYNQMAAELTLEKQRLEQNEAEHRRLTQELESKRQELASYADIFDEQGKFIAGKDPQEITRQIEALRPIKVEQQTREQEQRVKKIEFTTVHGELAAAEQAEQQNRINRAWKDALESIRRAFHPDGVPKRKITLGTQQMEGRVNSYLEILEVEFVVQAIEGLNFECHFPGGVARQTELSGGQQVDLSWAFRLGACETFASSVGLMCMDEPTVWLDEESRGCFNDIVEHLKVLAEKHGMQFLISTHDSNLIRHFGDVLKF